MSLWTRTTARARALGGAKTPIGRPIVDADARAAVETAVASSDMSCVDAWRELNEKCAAMAYTYYTQLLF